MKTIDGRTVTVPTRIKLAAVALLGLAALSACDTGTQGIFATIEKEREIISNNLVNDASITSLVKADTDVTGEARFVTVANTKVFTRLAAAGSDWDEVTAPGGRLAQFVGGIDTDSDELVEEVYAVFQTSGGQYGVYRLTSALGWTEVADFGSDRIGGMGTVAGSGIARVFLSVERASGTREVVHYAAGFASPQTISGFSQDVRDIAASNASNVLLLGRNGEIAAADDLGAADAATAVSFGGANPRGVTWDGSRFRFLITTRGGDVYAASANVVPPATSTGWTPLDVGVTRSFSDIVILPGTNRYALATERSTVSGTAPAGYYETTINTDTPPAISGTTNDLGSSFEGSELSIASINKLIAFPADGGGVELFALTNGLGLWRAVYTASTTAPEWVWE